MKRVAFVAIAALALLLAVVPTSNQAVDYATLVANQSGNFTWATTAPTPSHQLVTAGQFRALVQTTACPQSSEPANQIIDWNFVGSCAAARVASLQSQSISGSYSTVHYTATYNAKTGVFVCSPAQGSDAYTGTPVTLPAGTVAPTTSGTELSFDVASVSFPGTTTQLTVTLKNPSGVAVSSWVVTGAETLTYLTAAAPSGAWSWVVTQVGGTEGTCNSSSGASGGGTQVTWSGSVSWYQ